MAVSFLLFSASYFSLLSVVIEKAFGKIIGADIYAFNLIDSTSSLNETAINAFLDGVIAENPSDPLVTNYALPSMNLHSVLGGSDAFGTSVWLKDTSSYSEMLTNLIALPRNFMSVVNPMFYIPKDIQDGFDSDNT